LNTKKKTPGKVGANTAAIAPVQISSVKDLAQVILKLHGDSGQPIVDALLRIEKNTGTAITDATAGYTRTVNALGTDVFAAKKAATDASAAAELAKHSVDQANAAVAEANKILGNIPHGINDALREQLTVTVPVASAGGVAQEELMGGKLIAYIVDKMQLLEAAYADVKTQLASITAAPSLNSILSSVNEQLIVPLFRTDGAIAVASGGAQASAVEAKTALAQFRKELQARDEATAALIVACKKFLGNDLGSADMLAEMVVNAATPIVLGALKTDTYLQSVPELASPIGKDTVVSVLNGFVADSDIALDALCRAEGLNTAALDAEYAHLSPHLANQVKSIQERASQCISILTAPQEGV
jgi:hypothetical protein